MSLVFDPVWDWEWVLVITGALAALTVWTYAGVPGATRGRVLTILGLRLVALLLALMMVLRPSLAFENDPQIPSTLIVLLDSSKSMTIKDELGKSRWEKALAILRSPRVARLLKTLETQKKVRILFYRGAEDATSIDSLEQAGEADGRRTDLGQWLSTLYQRHGREANLRGLVIFSDGTDNGTRYAPADLAEQWQRVPCPIQPFALGKKETTLQQQDLAFDPESITVDPSPVPVKNKLTARARLVVHGFQSPRVTVRLFLDDGAEAAATKELVLDRPVPDRPDTYEVELSCDAPPTPHEMKVTLKVDPLQEELNPDNNSISTFVTVSKEGLSVLYVEGALRWEARFIRDAISGHRSLRLYKAFRTRDEPLEGQGDDFYQFAKRHYDVIIIGDISAERFAGGNAKVLAKVRDLVVKEGTGLLMLGGFETFGNSDWQTFGKPIADLLPVNLDQRGMVPEEVKIKVVPTPQGFAHYVMRQKGTPQENKDFWTKEMPPLDGMALMGSARRGASVLAIRDDNGAPVLVSATRGKGRVLAFAGDSTWKSWRRTPEAVKAHARFWQQAVVWLAHQEEAESQVWVTPDTRRVAVGTKLGFSLGMRNKEGGKVEDARFQVKVLGPKNSQTLIQTVREPNKDERGTFWKTDEAGEYRIEVAPLGKDGKPDTAKAARARFLVYEDDIEFRRPAANPEALEKIARRSDGQLHPATEDRFARYLEGLAQKPLLPDNVKLDVWPDWKDKPASRDLDDQVAALWSSGVLAWFLLFIAFICLEWLLRRRWGLV